jgi:ADP-heptose:LPS heptosyltransferase
VSETPRPIAVLVDREGLGDVMLKRPFLMALRRAFPDHPVWWIATHQSSMADELAPLLGGQVARVITHAALDGPIGPLRERLRALPRFERVFDSRTKVATVIVTRLTLRHHGFYCCLPGYALCDGRPPSRRRPRHIAARMTSLIACATGRPADPPPSLVDTPEAEAEARLHLPDGATYVGIAPGSRQASKNWPLERFCETARALSAEGVTPVFFLGPQEGAVETTIASLAPGARVIRAAPERAPGAGIDSLIAHARRLGALLANDNGVGHLMGAAGLPVVSLFGPTDPLRWAPVAPANLIVRAQEFGGGEEMAAIPASAVTARVMTMLDRVRAGADQVPPAM